MGKYETPMYETSDDAGKTWLPIGSDLPLPYTQPEMLLRLVLPDGTIAWQAVPEKQTESIVCWRWVTAP